MTTRTGRLVLGLLAFALLFLVALAVAIPKIENNLTTDVEQQLATAGIQGVGVTFSGRDGTLHGPPLLKEPSLAAVTDRWGIRSLEYESTGAAVVVPTTLAEPTTTAEVTVTTVEATTTTAAPEVTTTTEAPATTTEPPTTAPAVEYVDATATVSDQTITLSGTVSSSKQAQTLADAADAAFGLQGTVVNELAVKAQTAPAEIDRAVDGLAAFINAAGPGLLSGSGHLVNQTLDVKGEAFNAAAASTFNKALTSSAAKYGITVNGTVTPGPDTAAALQSSLNALLGRSGVNFAPNSATIDQRSQVVLSSAAESIKQVPGAKVQIVGYTDNDGPPDANLALSQDRADAVKTFLVDRGVPADDLTTLGKGEADPIAPNDTPENKAKNRRIEFIVQGS
jgi:outer membrane protein OmpA-like peptidoglycan-associated protein